MKEGEEEGLTSVTLTESTDESDSLFVNVMRGIDPIRTGRRKVRLEELPPPEESETERSTEEFSRSDSQSNQRADRKMLSDKSPTQKPSGFLGIARGIVRSISRSTDRYRRDSISESPSPRRNGNHRSSGFSTEEGSPKIEEVDKKRT